MSQEQLAAQLSVSRQAVSKWELDESLPDTSKLLAISKIFGVTTDYLLDDSQDNDGFEQIPIYNKSKSTIHFISNLIKKKGVSCWVYHFRICCAVSIAFKICTLCIKNDINAAGRVWYHLL